MNDQLIETFIHYVNLYQKEAKAYAQSYAGNRNTEIKNQHGKSTKTLLYWYLDKKLSTEHFEHIQKMAQRILPEEEMKIVGEFLTSDDNDKKRYTWEFHDKNIKSMIKNLRPLIKVLDFQAAFHNKNLLEGLRFTQSLFREQKKKNMARCGY